MRSHDFFGRKIRRSYAVRISLFLLVLVVVGALSLRYVQAISIADATALNTTLNKQLTNLIQMERQEVTYQTQSISVQIPNEIHKYEISKELEFAYSASGMGTPTAYKIGFTDDYGNSMYEFKPDGIIDVRIQLDFTTAHPEYLTKYLQAIMDTNHELLIEQVQVTTNRDQSATVKLQLASFYDVYENDLAE